MKKTIALIITAILVIGMLAACGKKEEAPQDGQSAAAPSGAIAAPDTLSGELNIYAAASMTESLDKVIGLFNAQHPNVTVNANYQSSGDLVKAIKAGGVCDIFISAGAKQMNQIDITADAEINTDGSDFVVPGTRFKMLQKVGRGLFADTAHRKRDVFVHGHLGDQAEVLENDAHGAAQIRDLAAGQALQIHIVDDNRTGGRLFLAHDQLQKGTFARARRADDEYEFTLSDAERDIIQRMCAVAGIYL